MEPHAKPVTGRFRAGMLATGLVGPLLLLTALSTAQDHPASPEKETAKQKFKNIQVFKEMLAGQLIPVMRSWNEALGVRCEYCHVITRNHTGFEKDDKPTKNTARQMVLMMQGLNKNEKVTKGKVTCIMCHHGKAEPAQHREATGEERKD
jgi:hypothetical protein